MKTSSSRTDLYQHNTIITSCIVALSSKQHLLLNKSKNNHGTLPMSCLHYNLRTNAMGVGNLMPEIQ